MPPGLRPLPLLGIPVAIVTAVVAGLLVGYPCFNLRITGHYFALLTLAFMAVGAVGVVSVASNLIPRGLSDIVSAALREDYAAARATHRKYYRLMNTLMKLDTNPVPIKTALEIKGMLSGAVRLPMVGMTEEKRAALATVLQDFTQP